MDKKIEAYIVGQIRLGQELQKKDPEHYAKLLLKTFPQIKEIDIITGEWDLMVKFEVKDMDEYYHVAWGIAKHIERGWGALVAKKVTR